jgi:hypothetical protein
MKPKVDPKAAREASAARRAADVAAYERMCASRPMKPPPLRIFRPTITAGQLELRKARRLGLAA